MPLNLTVHFPDGMFGTVRCVEVQPGRYRLEHSEPMLERPLYYGEVVQLDARPDGGFDFVRRTARAVFRRSCYMMTAEQSSSPELEVFLAAITAAGGVWEVWFKGILLLHLPREATIDPRAEWTRIFRAEPSEG